MKATALFGVPRSGTSWLGQILNSSPKVRYRYQPLFSYAFKNYLDLNSTKKDVDQFHKLLWDTEDDFVTQKKNISGNSAPQFSKDNPDHLIWKEVRYLNLIEHLIHISELNFVFILRHPCAVLNSWYKAPKEFNRSWSLEEEWLDASLKNEGMTEEFYGYNRWKEAALLFLNLAEIHPERVKIVVYEELNSNTQEVTEGLFKFFGLPFDLQTQKFIEDSKSKTTDDPYDVFRKAKPNNEWDGKLPSEIQKRILKDPDFLEINTQINWD